MRAFFFEGTVYIRAHDVSIFHFKSEYDVEILTSRLRIINGLIFSFPDCLDE